MIQEIRDKISEYLQNEFLGEARVITSEKINQLLKRPLGTEPIIVPTQMDGIIAQICSEFPFKGIRVLLTAPQEMEGKRLSFALTNPDTNTITLEEVILVGRDVIDPLTKLKKRISLAKRSIGEIVGTVFFHPPLNPLPIPE